MEELDRLKEKIEFQRNLLEEAITREEPSEKVYEYNLALDCLIEEYLDIVDR